MSRVCMGLLDAARWVVVSWMRAVGRFRERERESVVPVTYT